MTLQLYDKVFQKYRLFLDLDDKDKFILLLEEPYIAYEVGSFISDAMLERDKALTAQCQA